MMKQSALTKNKPTEFKKDRANQVQEESSNEQRTDNNNMGNENIHTNKTVIQEAMFNNIVNDGSEATKSSWPPGYTEYATNIKRNKKALGGTKYNSTRGSMDSTFSKRFMFSEADFVRVSELSNIIGGIDLNKKRKISKILNKFTVNFAGLHETFMTTDNLFSLRSIWGNSQFDYAFVPSSGHLGGIISIWNPDIFIKHKIISNPNVLIVEGRWLDVKLDIFMVNVSSSALINFKNKLQGLKGAIKGWVNARRSRIEVIDSLSAELRNLDLNIDVGQDGDENSKFFHGTLNRKRKQLSVRGIKSNRFLVEDPMAVKQTFFNHCSQKFARVTSIPYSTRRNRFRLVSQHQLEILESQVSLEEIKDAVWDCGNDKSPGPDGFMFGFVKRPISLIGILYKIIAKIIACRIALIIDDIVDPVRSAFIKNRQILDGPMILNEVVHTLKGKNKKAMIFKVDIAKAYDTLSWDYLISVSTLWDLVTIAQSEDSWRWSCDTMDSFSVNALRKHLDCLSLPSHYLATRWNKIVPRKVNIHVWRLIKDRFPTRFNLWFRGIDDVSLICPMCSNGLESIYHTMLESIITIKVWKSVVKWLDLNLPFQLPRNEFLDFVNSQGNLHMAKDILFTIIYTTWWELWKFRNDSIFRPAKKDVGIVDSIIHFSYLWFQNRHKKAIGLCSVSSS
nr:transposon TX1 putative 149 kDa protein [Tanacetum cinerariifolium]